MTHYSIFSVLREAMRGNTGWQRAWRDPEPKPAYDVIIIGAGHGLATAYYLAKEHGVTNVAVLEKGWLGGGNMGRNTTIIRSNYLLDPNTQFYEFSMKLWEGLAHDLNFNAMVSHRGIINLGHGPRQMHDLARRGNIMQLNGIDAELLTRADVMRKVPVLDYSDTARFPIAGGLYQGRAGTVRHDAVAWGYARAADKLGVDIIQNCEVTGFQRDANGAVVGVETTRGNIAAKKVAMAVAGHSGQLAAKLDLRLPIETHILQAFVTEPVKPILDLVVTFGAGHFYVSQTDKGGVLFGADLDGHNSYSQRGGLSVLQDQAVMGKALLPSLSRLKIARQWAGVMDMSMDGSPIICTGPIPGLFLNCGWCYGGFKATPASGWTYAWTIAKDEPHPLNAGFTLDRFRTGAMIDERGAGPAPGHH
jgi:sarcosine oxidase subunit beta